MVRWTVGPVSSIGMEILKYSVNLFHRCYPEFDRVVCYNHMDWPSDLNLGVPLYKQKAESFSYPLTPRDSKDRFGGTSASGWKLCPPRLNPNGKELFLDNDVVIHERVPAIDHWLQEGGGLVSESPRRRYAAFDKHVSPSINACAGLFGVPEGFDLEQQALRYCQLLKLYNLTLGGFDEQGLVVAIITNMEKFTIASLSQVAVCRYWPCLCPTPMPPAIHFIGANRKERHRPWEDFMKRKLTGAEVRI